MVQLSAVVIEKASVNFLLPVGYYHRNLMVTYMIKTRCRDRLVETKNKKDGELNGSPNDSLVANNSATNNLSRYAPISIIFVLCCIIEIVSFGEYLFVYREILNQPENTNLNCAFVNAFGCCLFFAIFVR